MTTARDLAIVALDAAAGRSVEQGDLSLALAGAEVLDLMEAGAVVLEGDRIRPGTPSPTGDHLLDEAAAALVRQEPYESVEDWLWRRGRGLSSAYADDFERVGLTARPRGRLIPLRAGRTVPVDSAARRQAEDRWAAGEPVLAALAAAAGLGEKPTEEPTEGPTEGPAEEPAEESAEESEALAGGTAATVLAAVGDAVLELEGVRQRRTIENAAFDNIWRGF
ncbi:GPP34 family phosphoprotein [Streptomyces lincolnensis]|uniref:GOLPH3/VPS74 family protein n=1 Tax=Streptomyces lincolnensis TaxID=1915 RepID=UPI001E4C64EB|nr:GPP34 family phosphoprotein [Streptomyces lincolnensis]MCD7443335.1 GPP34 family phosphoprotein [Streptomyces lincolnensis]